MLRGEEGLDYGGVAREWFFTVSHEVKISSSPLNPSIGKVHKKKGNKCYFCPYTWVCPVKRNIFPFWDWLKRTPCGKKALLCKILVYSEYVEGEKEKKGTFHFFSLHVRS